MKVIDLLNKIAKSEQPSHIRVYGRDWYWNNYDGYVTKESLTTTPDAQCYLFSQYRLDFTLDKEVEIIEENKEIEELNLKDGKVIGTWENGSEYCYTLSAPQVVIIKKINELVKAVNSLKEDK